MKKIVTVLAVLVLAFTPLIPLKTAEVRAASQVLRVYNWEDYIDEDCVSNFETWCKEEYDIDVTVEYSTFGTNEIMYNEMKINKKNDSYGYDLACPSDYMIQRMLKEDMLVKIGTIANYETYGSGYMKDLFAANSADGKVWADYSVCYMWGTLGFVYNPESVYKSDMSSWGGLWNIDYKGKTTLKDSIRDTYFLGVAYVYRDELNDLADTYAEDGDINAYQTALSEVLNRTDADTVAKVEKSLKNVKSNIYSFELDEGKNDMATGKVSINFCWSGDAVYAMDQADEDEVELYYSVPKEGSNVWFDGWVMPKGANVELAQKFLEYLSLPEVAITNMEYIGYTSAITGNDVYDWMVENYELTPADDGEYDLSYLFDNISGTDANGDVRVAKFDMDSIEYGRHFTAQYPEQAVIDRCTVMLDFEGENLARINAMWERVKGNTLPAWVIIVIVVGVLLIAAAVVLFVLYKKGKLFKKKGFKRVEG